MTCAAPPPTPPAIIARARPQASQVRPQRLVVRPQPQAPRRPAARRVATLCTLPALPPVAVNQLQPLELRADALPAGGSFLPLPQLPPASFVANAGPLVLDPPGAGPVARQALVRWDVAPAWLPPAAPPTPWLIPAPLPVVSEPPTWLLMLAAMAAAVAARWWRGRRV